MKLTRNCNKSRGEITKTIKARAIILVVDHYNDMPCIDAKYHENTPEITRMKEIISQTD